MKKIAAAIALFTLLVGCRPKETMPSPADYVSTLGGTLSDFSMSTGNTYPATALPWGMNFWTPQTGPMGDGWTYNYSAHKIRGIKQTHQPSPWINDYGQFSIMPVRDVSLVGEDDRASVFSHQSETARPYYYQVYLADHDVNVELAPSERAAIIRLTFPESESSGVVVDAFDKGSYVKIIPQKNMVVGYTTRNSGGVPDNFRNWFAAVFDKDFDGYNVYEGSVAVKGAELEGEHAIAVVRFATKRGEQVNLRVASSFISLEQAERNLCEVLDKDFDSAKESARGVWNRVLGRIEVSGGSVDEYKTFYSCLYRSVLFPRKFYEVNSEGKPIHYSPYDGEVHEGYMYTDSGFWDTFRALFPLLNLVYPSVNKEIQLSLANVAMENEFLPEWASPGHRGCMVGNNSASLIADAIVKDISTDYLDTLYAAVKYGTEHVHPEISSTGRLGWEYYNSLGYVPYDVDIKENVARTLEYAYDDWCILQMARHIGAPEEECSLWAQRAQNYKNVFDPESKLMRGRNKDGSFQEPFSPYKWGDAYTEGNAWHYTWSVFHDVQGLLELMGGDEAFAQMLDSVFIVPPIYDDSYYGFRIHEIAEMQVANMGNYAHGNQPAQHVIYLYDYCRQPWKAQSYVRETMRRLYSPGPDAYCGDEDNGQTSAWYVFSALGFYPLCPGSDEYALGSPLFKSAVIHLENGNDIVMKASDNSPENVYVASLKLNGKNWSHNFLRYGDLLSGATLRFRMDSVPCTTRGITDEDKPYSFSKECNQQ